MKTKLLELLRKEGESRDIMPIFFEASNCIWDEKQKEYKNSSGEFVGRVYTTDMMLADIETSPQELDEIIMQYESGMGHSMLADWIEMWITE